MKILAYVDQSTGEILSTVSVSVSVPSHEDGSIVDGHLVKDISFVGSSWNTFAERNYWDGQWIERNYRPSNYHSWIDKEWVFVPELLMSHVRNVRSDLISRTDWTRIDDNGLDDDDRELWAIYRQELRDLPELLDGIESLNDVPWPEPPQ